MSHQVRKPFLFDANEFERQIKALNIPQPSEASIRVATAERDALKAAIGNTHEILSRVIVIDGKAIPLHVAEWMLEHELPWEAFWCYEHSQWFEELDSSFPYFAEFNQCCKCEEGL